MFLTVRECEFIFIIVHLHIAIRTCSIKFIVVFSTLVLLRPAFSISSLCYYSCSMKSPDTYLADLNIRYVIVPYYSI